MFGVIEKVGMDLIFINMVCIISITKKISINVIGALTKSFSIYMGVWQGYPLVLYIFIFVGKAFNHIIKKVVGRGYIEYIYHVLLS